MIELRSKTDSLQKLRAKMEEYRQNGCRLGWLINVQDRQVEVYRPDVEISRLEAIATLSAEDMLPGLQLDLQMVWQ